jgi:competence protein ComEA
MVRRCLSMFVMVLGLATVGFAQTPAPGAEAKPPKAVVVNLNTATQAELESLPGIGARVAARIVEYRQKNGPFKKIEELMNVQGVGEKSFLKLRSQLTVGTKPDLPGQQ